MFSETGYQKRVTAIVAAVSVCKAQGLPYLTQAYYTQPNHQNSNLLHNVSVLLGVLCCRIGDYVISNEMFVLG